MSLSSRSRAFRVLLGSTALALLTLVLGYFIAESFPVVLLTSIAVAYVIMRAHMKHSEGSADVFVDYTLSSLLGVFIYLVIYYVAAGAYVGPRLGLSPLGYLLLMMRASVFLAQYIMYSLTYLIVGFILLFLLTAILHRG